MKPEDRRAARAAYKEKKSVAGIFALRCLATGAVWVGATPDIDKIWNRLLFTLRGDGHPRRELQAAWNAHGEAAFAFEALERLEDEALDFARRAAFDDRAAHWRAELGAAPI